MEGADNVMKVNVMYIGDGYPVVPTPSSAGTSYIIGQNSFIVRCSIHCIICRFPDFTVSEFAQFAGTEPTPGLLQRRHWQSDALTTQLHRSHLRISFSIFWDSKSKHFGSGFGADKATIHLNDLPLPEGYKC